MKNCHICNKGKLKEVSDILVILGEKNLVSPGERCDHCNEEFFNEKELQRIINEAKQQGVWGTNRVKLFRKLTKTEKGILIRIPLDIERSLHLEGNEEVSITTLGKNKLVIEILN